MSIKKKTLYSLLIVSVLVILDQAFKVYIKTHFYLGQEIVVIDDWFRLLFTENPGAAFGVEIGGVYGKYMLSIFRITFSVFITWLLIQNIKNRIDSWLVISNILILAGAIGNIIDGIFYDVIFTKSHIYTQKAAEFIGFSNGMNGLLKGKVVDMFYFPLVDTILPNWFPLKGGERFVFFNPIFNIADSFITIGVTIFLFNSSKMDKK